MSSKLLSLWSYLEEDEGDVWRGAGVFITNTGATDSVTQTVKEQKQLFQGMHHH